MQAADFGKRHNEIVGRRRLDVCGHRSSNVDLRVHARAPWFEPLSKFEPFDHVGSQNSSVSKWRAGG